MTGARGAGALSTDVKRAESLAAVWTGDSAMRRFTCLFCAIVSATVITHSANAAAQPAVTTDRLADGVYLLRAPEALDFWTATNSVVIVNDEDVVVFDSFTRPSTARSAIAEIRKVTSKPVRTLINSHWHQDHWRGNDEFVKAFPGVQIVTTVEQRDYMRRMQSGFLIDGTRAQLARERAALAAAITTGTQADGTALTPETRRTLEAAIADRARFAEEMAAAPFVVPDVAYRGELTFWRGTREFRLLTMTGDATASAVLYLPNEQVLVTGDVLVSPENGDGPPPWTTNSYAIAPWLESLRRMGELDTKVIVPGQGPAMRDTQYLTLTTNLFAAITAQVHGALERGLFKVDDVVAEVNVDTIGRRYPGGLVGPNTPFQRWVGIIARKVLQEAHDGIARPN
jgi:cyclase